MTSESNKKEVYRNGKIYIIGDIDTDLEQEIHIAIDQLEIRGKKQVTAILSTDGGDLESAFSIYSRMCNSKITFKIEAYGRVYSAGMVVLCAGTERVADKFCSFMSHEIQDITLSGTEQQRQSDNSWYKFLNNKMYQILGSHTNIKPLQWKKLCTNNHNYFTIKEAIKIELISKSIK